MRSEASVTGIYIQHPVHGDSAAVIHGAPAGGNTVDGLEVPVGVEEPDDGAVACRIGAQATVQSRTQHRAGDGSRCTSLSGATSLSGVLHTELGLRWLIPDRLAVRDPD